MSQQQNYLFPYVLDILGHKPLLSENQNTLLTEIEQKLGDEAIEQENLKEDLDTVVKVGKNLGILSVHEDEIGLPFLLTPNKRNAFPNATTSEADGMLAGTSVARNVKMEHGFERHSRRLNPDINRTRSYINGRSRSRRRVRRSSRSRSRASIVYRRTRRYRT